MKQEAVFQGKPVYRYTLQNSNGMELEALNYGAVITAVRFPEEEGKRNLVLAYDDLAEYEQNPYYFGAVIGRTSGRTKGAVIDVDSTRYELEANDGENHLHGGSRGLAHRFFQVEQLSGALVFICTIPDKEDGYPGTLDVKVTYTLTDENELHIDYEARADRTTPVNLTNHSYFNLGGKTVLDHTLQLDAGRVFLLEEGSLPKEEASVDGHPVFDFQSPRRLGEGILQDHEQTTLVQGGIDHPFLLNGNSPAAVLSSPETGRTMTVTTDQPAVVMYTGNQMNGTRSINGSRETRHGAVCLETQHPPDQTEAILLPADKTYRSRTTYSFA
ncbi:aldose epimerase family protein [Alkalicoccus urumqiensis]|uniref:Aldose 1-epimerase n=1 Tax=Alkalicoccus urumqiensis TaxID=1548213 RepID=A0A2P6MEJ9_ALKUR|nr:aldose epimerase family protein [Alkalicoccus urumqiensis]PRO64706.1 galactose-1-epimerase [Alkalicoccus urumqiensis]